MVEIFLLMYHTQREVKLRWEREVVTLPVLAGEGVIERFDGVCPFPYLQFRAVGRRNQLLIRQQPRRDLSTPDEYQTELRALFVFLIYDQRTQNGVLSISLAIPKYLVLKLSANGICGNYSAPV